MTYPQVEKILKENGYQMIRQRGSHRRFKAIINGKFHFVTLANHRKNEQVDKRILAAIIRQSGLDKKLFR